MILTTYNIAFIILGLYDEHRIPIFDQSEKSSNLFVLKPSDMSE